MRILFIYLRYIVFTFVFFFKIHKYITFLKRKTRLGSPSLRSISKSVDNRVRAESRYGEHRASREDLLIHFFIGALREKTVRGFKEELELPLLLMFIWYCEPIDVQFSQEDKKENK